MSKKANRYIKRSTRIKKYKGCGIYSKSTENRKNDSEWIRLQDRNDKEIKDNYDYTDDDIYIDNDIIDIDTKFINDIIFSNDSEKLETHTNEDVPYPSENNDDIYEQIDRIIREFELPDQNKQSNHIDSDISIPEEVVSFLLDKAIITLEKPRIKKDTNIKKDKDRSDKIYNRKIDLD